MHLLGAPKISALRAITILLVAVAALIAPMAAAQQASPIDVIRDYQAKILDTMRRADSLGYEGRYEQLEPAIRRAFDLAFLAKRSIGSSRWNQLSEEQRQNYVEAYARFTVATHASRFKGYSGEEFRQLGTQDMPRGFVLVKTELAGGNARTVPINYLMADRDGDWQIVDVFLNGTISEVATRRSEFGSVVSNNGFDALIALLEDRIQRARQN